MNSKAYQHSSQLSIGEIKTELKPTSDFEDRPQVLDAMSSAVHSSLMTWVIDNTTDPGTKGGRQEKIKQVIEYSGQQVAELIVSVPTTPNYSKALFEGFMQQGLVPAAQKVFRSYAEPQSGSRRAAGQSHIADQTLTDTLEQTRKVSPRQLQSR
jgi:hypothetical protein